MHLALIGNSKMGEREGWGVVIPIELHICIYCTLNMKKIYFTWVKKGLRILEKVINAVYAHLYTCLLAVCSIYSAGHFEKERNHTVSYIQDTDTSKTLLSELLMSLRKQ